MANHRIGGINVFGGGLGLYSAGKRAVGGIGVSGDTSCADHNIAWRIRSIHYQRHEQRWIRSPAMFEYRGCRYAAGGKGLTLCLTARLRRRELVIQKLCDTASLR
jgi:hypothetical protein